MAYEHVLAEVFDTPMMMLDNEAFFVSPYTGESRSPALYARDGVGNHYVLFFDEPIRALAKTSSICFDRLQVNDPEHDVFCVFVGNYLPEPGMYRIDPKPVEPKTDDEWVALGCNPSQPDPDITKLHTILYDPYL